PTDAQKEAFVAALWEHGSSTERRAAIQHDLHVSKGMVSHWLNGANVPNPDQVFAIEKTCELPAGDLSRHLGYVPVGGLGSTVLGAIEADETLTPKQRRAFAALLRTVLSLESSS